jgi:hypothetical protein
LHIDPNILNWGDGALGIKGIQKFSFIYYTMFACKEMYIPTQDEVDTFFREFINTISFDCKLLFILNL